MNLCEHIKSDGTNCSAHPLKNGVFCFRHEPTVKVKAINASKTGGENRRLQQKCGETVKIENASDITLLLADTINGVWTGAIPVQVGTSIGFLSNCWLKAHEISTQENKSEGMKILLDL